MRAVVIVLVACVASSASAGTTFAATASQSYGYQTDIGSGGAIVFDTVVRGVAVSTDDDRIFVVRQFDPNAGAGGFEVLDPNGTSISTAATSVIGSGIAVSPDGNSVYALGAGSFGGTPVKLTSDGAPTPTYTEDPLWVPSGLLATPTDIAVDPTTGEVLLAAGTTVVRIDPTTGAQVSSFNAPVTPSGPMTATRIAVAPNGDIYALDNLAGQIGLVHLGPDGSLKARLALPAEDNTWDSPGLAVNPQNGDVAVELNAGFETENDAVIRIYTAGDTLKDTFRVPAAVASGNAGLAFSSDASKLYVGQAEGTAHVYALGTRPGLDAPTVSQIEADGFRVDSAVATAGQAATVRFEYCLASEKCTQYLTSDAPSPWHALPNHAGLSDPTDDVPFNDTVTGLQPNSDYLVRAYAIGDTSHVENLTKAVTVRTALLPPAVTTGGANADVNSAELTGTINTIGGQTTYHFEYGLTTNYGSSAPAGAEAIAGNLRQTRTFSKTIKGLQPGTTYHYRLVATNAAGTSYGVDRTFTTLGADQVAPRRGYEQVTSPHKNGLSVNTDWGFQARPEGGAIEYTAAAPSADASSAAQSSRYIARRDATDWIGQQPLDPPLGPIRIILASPTHAVSGDFRHAMVVTSVALTPDAVQGAANIYVTDVDTGAYHLVGTATEPGAYGEMVGTKQANVFIAGAPDFSWVVLISRFPLLPGAPQVAMYKWSKTQGLSIISRLPDGPNGGDLPAGDVAVQGTEFVTNRLVSNDGNTAAFTLVHGNDGVYVRSGDKTTAISTPPNSTTPQPGIALGMSTDGKYVVFISHSALTADADDLTASSQMNLYRYNTQTPGLELLGKIEGSSGGWLDVFGISEDGGTVYFNRPREDEDENHNPIVVHEFAVWRNGQVHTVTSGTLAAASASPNGQYVVFLKNGSVYYYNADSGDQATCISCTVSGQGGGAQLPVNERNISNRLPQAVSNDGHAYFGTTLPLLSSDHNRTRDVYEYYRGRLTLISPGDLDYTATFVDMSADGRDVYFTTAEPLVGQDTDQAYDIYDARIGGGIASQNPPPPPAPCAKSECAEPGPGPVASPPVGSLPQPSGKSAKRTNQAKVKLSLTRVSIGSKTMKITFHASQRGRVTVSGSRIVKAYKNVTKEGTYSISVRLSKKARSLHHAKKKFKIAVKVSLAGGWGTASAKYSRTLNK